MVPETARGGGVCVAEGRLVMNGSSAIRGNSSAWLGGGLDAVPRSSYRRRLRPGWQRLRQHARRLLLRVTVPRYVGCLTRSHELPFFVESVRDGGVFHALGRLVGVTCGPDGNVYGNTPGDCYIE